MRRVIAVISSFLVFFLQIIPVAAQTPRGRMDTRAGQQQLGPAPSFRGGAQQGLGSQQYDESLMQGGLQFPQGQGGLGEAAAMMGAGYSVHVLGEVERPGTYNMPASTRVAQAVQRAGGIAFNGSERNVEVRRKGGGTKHVDLLRFKLYGDLNQNPYLTDNDVVFVPLRGKVVQIVGAVKRPNLYELRSEKKLRDAIELAGGFNNAVAKDEPIRIIRFEDGEKLVLEVPNNAEALSRYSVHSGDVVVIANAITKDTEFDYNVASIPGDQVFYPSYEDRVFVLGGVAFPGAYPFSPYYTLSQYISLAGGLSDRGTDKYKVTSIDGKTQKAALNQRVNPGDTIMVKQKTMSNAAWAGFALSLASFGLSASSTIIALRR